MMRRRLQDSAPHAKATRKLRPMAHRERADAQKKEPVVPQHDALRFVPLGGLEEIGRNMMFFEHKDEIVIIDMGFQFPEEETPGIDYIIPNISYLESKKQNIKAVILTHANLDHVGAVPYLMGKLGNPADLYCCNDARDSREATSKVTKCTEIEGAHNKELGQDPPFQAFHCR